MAIPPGNRPTLPSLISNNSTSTASLPQQLQSNVLSTSTVTPNSPTQNPVVQHGSSAASNPADPFSQAKASARFSRSTVTQSQPAGIASKQSSTQPSMLQTQQPGMTNTTGAKAAIPLPNLTTETSLRQGKTGPTNPGLTTFTSKNVSQQLSQHPHAGYLADDDDGFQSYIDSLQDGWDEPEEDMSAYHARPTRRFYVHPDYDSATQFVAKGHIPADSAHIVTDPHFRAIKEHLLGHTKDILDKHNHVNETIHTMQLMHDSLQKKIEKNPDSPKAAGWITEQQRFAQEMTDFRKHAPQHSYTAPDGVIEELREHHWKDLHGKISECRNFTDLRNLARHSDSAKFEDWFRDSMGSFHHHNSMGMQFLDSEGVDRGEHKWREPSVKNAEELEKKYHLGGLRFHHQMSHEDISQATHMLSNGLDDLAEAMGIEQLYGQSGYNTFGKHMQNALRIQVANKGGFDGTGAAAKYMHAQFRPTNTSYGVDSSHPVTHHYTYPVIRLGSEYHGSLAHEFGHALDYMGEHIEDEGHRSQYQEQIKKIKDMVGASPVGQQTVAADEWVKTHPDPDLSLKKLIRDGKYFSKPEERFARAFEQHIHHKLQQKGKVNSFLTRAHYATDKEHAVFLKEHELHPFHDEFDKLFELIKNSPSIQKALFGFFFGANVVEPEISDMPMAFMQKAFDDSMDTLPGQQIGAKETSAAPTVQNVKRREPLTLQASSQKVHAQGVLPQSSDLYMDALEPSSRRPKTTTTMVQSGVDTVTPPTSLERNIKKTFLFRPKNSTGKTFTSADDVPVDSAYVVTDPHFQSLKEHFLEHVNPYLKQHDTYEKMMPVSSKKYNALKQKMADQSNSPSMKRWKSEYDALTRSMYLAKKELLAHTYRYTTPEGNVEKATGQYWRDLHNLISGCGSFKEMRNRIRHPNNSHFNEWFNEKMKTYSPPEGITKPHIDSQGFNRGSHKWRQPSVDSISELEQKYHLGGLYFDDQMSHHDMSHAAHMLSNGLDDLAEAMGIDHVDDYGRHKVFGEHLKKALRVKVLDKGGFDGSKIRALFRPPIHQTILPGQLGQGDVDIHAYTYPEILLGSEYHGTLAHEFGHALDYMGEHIEDEGHRSQYQEQIKKIKDMVGASPVGQQTAKQDELIRNLPEDERKQWHISGDSYFSRPDERFARAFEQHIHHKLQQKGKVNSFLTQSSYATDKEHAVFLKEHELHPFHDEFDKLFELIKKSPEIQKALLYFFGNGFLVDNTKCVSNSYH